MKTFYLSLRSLRCKLFSTLIIFIQLAICFSILIYTANAVFLQFDVIYTANGANRGYLRLTPDSFFTQKYELEWRALDIENKANLMQMVLDFKEKEGLSKEQLITTEQYDSIYKEYMALLDSQFDQYHIMEKYQYPDLYDRLSESGYAADTISNYEAYLLYDDKKTGHSYGVQVVLMDEKLYDTLRLKIENGVDLNNYTTKDNHFYVVMYPDVYINNEDDGYIYEVPYKVGDVLTEEVYNIKEQCYETFYYEIVGELEDPAYIIPALSYSGSGEYYTTFGNAFLGSQPMQYSGALLAIKPNDFDRMNYYTNFIESLTLVKPDPELSKDEYSDLMDIIWESGFNSINLDDAERNTIDEIVEFIRENSLILIASVVIVVFSMISISILQGSQVRREYGVYRLCGADLGKVKALSAVKWALIFVPAMVVGVVIAIVYSIATETFTFFIGFGTVAAGIVFAVLYIVSFYMSYKSASASYKSAELSE